MTARPSRTAAEWASLVGSALVVLTFVALIAVRIPGADRPAAPWARVEEVRQVGDAFHVDVTVGNDGDETAAEVQVAAELTVDGELSSGDQTLDFLAGGEESDLTFVFEQDPSLGDLRVVVTGYAAP